MKKNIIATNPAAKAKGRQEEFPKDCEAAFAMGARLVKGVNRDGLN